MSCLLEPLLETAKVARLLGVEVETLGAWRRRGYGPCWYRIGKKIKYAESDLRARMSAQASAGVSLRPSEVQQDLGDLDKAKGQGQ
ncbi:MAG: helix-turn-helix domain-containing protein [Bryobacteraceae bacterium]|jgi:predicted site-specific integrase-resolvase